MYSPLSKFTRINRYVGFRIRDVYTEGADQLDVQFPQLSITDYYIVS